METVLVFAGIPVAVAMVIAGLVYTGSARRSKRYRPGRPFEFRPVWFLSAPEEALALTAGAARPAVTAGPASGGPASDKADEWPVSDPGQQAVTGGASDRW